jgi:hypothetical protein
MDDILGLMVCIFSLGVSVGMIIAILVMWRYIIGPEKRV